MSDRHREYMKQWNRDNPNHSSQQRRKKERVHFVRDIKKGLCCKSCGMSDFRCLHFHHRDSEEKVATVATMVQKFEYSYEDILAEIAKCDVFCANCHMILHYRD